MLRFTADLHIHTTLSECCTDPEQTPEKLIEFLANEKHLHKIAFTDHIWDNPDHPGSTWYAPQTSVPILKQKARFAGRSDLPLNVLFGCEADMQTPEIFSITPEIKAQMDLVLLASDHFHMKSFVAQPEDQTPSALAKHMMTFFRAAAVSGLADILVHPLWPYSFEPVYADAVALISENELTESLRMAAENHVAMELNGSVIAKKAIADPANRDAYLRIMSAAKTAGCKFTFGSDSHNRSQFELMAETARFAVEAGITAADLSPFMMAE